VFNVTSTQIELRSLNEKVIFQILIAVLAKLFLLVCVFSVGNYTPACSDLVNADAEV